jgi:hypothetical protein
MLFCVEVRQLEQMLLLFSDVLCGIVAAGNIPVR